MGNFTGLDHATLIITNWRHITEHVGINRQQTHAQQLETNSGLHPKKYFVINKTIQQKIKKQLLYRNKQHQPITGAVFMCFKDRNAPVGMHLMQAVEAAQAAWRGTGEVPRRQAGKVTEKYPAECASYGLRASLQQGTWIDGAGERERERKNSVKETIFPLVWWSAPSFPLRSCEVKCTSYTLSRIPSSSGI